MLKKLLLGLTLILTPNILYAQNTLSCGSPVNSFTNAAIVDSAAGTSYALYSNLLYVTWQTSFSSAPSAVSLSLQGSLNGTDWSSIDTSTSTTGDIRNVTGSNRFIRAFVNSHTGGSGMTVTINCSKGSGAVNVSGGGTVNAGNDICFGTNGGCISQTTGATPNVTGLWTGTTNNTWVVSEYADRAVASNYAAKTDPTIRWLGSTPSATYSMYANFNTAGVYGEIGTTGGAGILANSGFFWHNSGSRAAPGLGWSALSHQYGWYFSADSNGAYVGRTTQGADDAELMSGNSNALTEASATSLVRIGIPSGAQVGGRFEYTVMASDGTDHQSRHGRTNFTIVNKAGVETCVLSAASETTDGSALAASLGTLTYTITCDTTPVNAVDLDINATSSLVQTSLIAKFRIWMDTSDEGGGVTFTLQ